MVELRVRTVIPDDELQEKIGKIVTPADFNVLLTGATRLFGPDGKLMLVYAPGALSGVLAKYPTIYEVLHSLKSMVTDNRGDASGSPRFRYGEEKRTRSKKVASAILGSFDPSGPKQFCRQTAWTGQHADRFTLLRPLFQQIGSVYAELVPERFKAQMAYVERTYPEWIIPGTPFSTITVNNTYPTGVHQDKGDLEDGFSTLAVLRRGSLSGGLLVFPRYRIAIDMQDGDLALFDAHQWHGNTALSCPHAEDPYRCTECERISLVSYYRTGMADCDSSEAEYRKAVSYAERRSGVGRGEDAGTFSRS